MICSSVNRYLTSNLLSLRIGLQTQALLNFEGTSIGFQTQTPLKTRGASDPLRGSDYAFSEDI